MRLKTTEDPSECLETSCGSAETPHRRGVRDHKHALCSAAALTSVMAFRAVSEPTLRSEPGTLLDTVAGTMTMGTHNSLYLSRAAESSSNPM